MWKCRGRKQPSLSYAADGGMTDASATPLKANSSSTEVYLRERERERGEEEVGVTESKRIEPNGRISSTLALERGCGRWRIVKCCFKRGNFIRVLSVCFLVAKGIIVAVNCAAVLGCVRGAQSY